MIYEYVARDRAVRLEIKRLDGKRKTMKSKDGLTKIWWMRPKIYPEINKAL